MARNRLGSFKLAKALFLATVFVCFGEAHALAAPAIEFTSVSPYGDPDGSASGVVSGVDFSRFKVAGFIEVDDSLWTKPTLAAPLTDISPDGSFSFDFTTGGYDAFAARVLAFVVPYDIDVESIQCFPCCKDFLVAEAVATASYSQAPRSKKVNFAGYKWTVKRRDFPAGPGGNYFSDRRGNVWVDTDGLHLVINKRRDGTWQCAEVILGKSLGYGIYRVVTNSRVDRYDKNIVGGLFLWDTLACDVHNREIDIVEFARWGDDLEYTNAQNVVHPCNACPGCGNNCERFRVDLTKKRKLLTHFLIWTPGQAEFRTYRGNLAALPSGTDERLVHSWIYDGPDLPEPGNERVRFNLWLFGGNPPSDGRKATLLIRDFSFMPSEDASMVIDGVSPYGSTNGDVWGHVVGVDPSQFVVETYILVRGGWWSKPYWDTPFTPIKSDNTWRCDIATGGVDHEATKVVACLVPKGTPARLASGGSTIPPEVYTDAVACAEVSRQP